MRNKIDESVDIKTIRNYLRDHPDFFDKNPDILETMVIHHKTDGAISLVERRLQALQEKNISLENKLNSLINNAEQNQNIFENIMTLASRVLTAQNLLSLLDILDDSFKNVFKIKYHKLIIFDEFVSIDHPSMVFNNEKELKKAIPKLSDSGKQFSGEITEQAFQLLFDKKNQIHNSVVLCKITNESPNAYLAFGSDDPDLYKQSDSKYFLLHLANLVGQSFIKFIKEV